MSLTQENFDDDMSQLAFMDYGNADDDQSQSIEHHGITPSSKIVFKNNIPMGSQEQQTLTQLNIKPRSLCSISQTQTLTQSESMIQDSNLSNYTNKGSNVSSSNINTNKNINDDMDTTSNDNSNINNKIDTSSDNIDSDNDNNDENDDNLELKFEDFDETLKPKNDNNSEYTSNNNNINNDSINDIKNSDDGNDDDNDDEIIPYDFSKLPSHACAYCGIHNPGCVVKCDQCNKWFCNSRINTAGSHIIHHLVRSKHKNISLHKNCPIGDTSLECYNCGTRNIFVLGFVPATNDGVVVLLCREQCLHYDKLKEMEWDGQSWQPLIKDRELLEWLVTKPQQNELLKSKSLTSSEMNKLEELWKVDPNATVKTLTESSVNNEEIEHVLITYEDASHFQRIYQPLVTLESDYDKKMKESQVYYISCNIISSERIINVSMINKYIESGWYYNTLGLEFG